MAETTPTANFDGMRGYSVVVYDTGAVPDEVWREAQTVHHESLRAVLPADQKDRADAIAKINDFNSYRDTRADPNLMVGNGWNGGQLFRRPRFTTIWDGSHQLVGGVLTADNTSARLPLPTVLQPLEYGVKMLVPPGLPIPIIGGKRYHHLREVYSRPDAQTRPEAGDEATVVSGVALTGIFYALAQAHPEQRVATYPIPDDPADTELTNISKLLGMIETGDRAHELPGYTDESKLVRTETTARRIAQEILALPGAMTAIYGTHHTRATK